MENISNGWNLISAGLAAIVLISNAAEKIVKAWKVAKAPNDVQNDRLDALEKWKNEVDGKLKNDHNELKNMEDGMRVTQKALLALLDHGIDGNNTRQMQDAKKALQEYLINNK